VPDAVARRGRLRLQRNCTASAYTIGTGTTTRVARGEKAREEWIVDGRAVKKYGHARPQDAWPVLLREHHEGYVSWEDYERNQERIQKNAYAKPAGDAKSGRGGRALLSSRLRCRRCGRMLRRRCASA
jgi:hypothetical protein